MVMCNRPRHRGEERGAEQQRRHQQDQREACLEVAGSGNQLVEGDEGANGPRGQDDEDGPRVDERPTQPFRYAAAKHLD